MTTTNSVVANAIKAQAVRNERLVPFDRDAVKPGDSVWYKGREFEYKGMRGTGNVLLADVFDGEEETVFAYDRNLKMAANAIGDLDFDMKGVYETAKKMLAAGATHKGGYHWSVPKTYATGAGVVASRVGGAVKVVRNDPDRAGFVIAEITDPLAQALERKGVPNAATARNAERAKNSKASGMVAKELIRLTTEARSIYNNIKRKVDEIKKAKAQVSALTLQVDSSIKKILDIEKEGELTIRALDENDPDWKEAGAAYQRFLHEMWDIKREIQ